MNALLGCGLMPFVVLYATLAVIAIGGAVIAIAEYRRSSDD